MKLTIRCCFVIGLACFILPLAQCAAPSSSGQFDAAVGDAGRVRQGGQYETEYSAEILAYLMQVVLGKRGDPSMRDAWYSRGSGAELDFHQVSQVMSDPNGDKKQILVLDNNILGLLKILYYYNSRLNLFKGKRHQESVYPSVELLSVRLLLLRKLHQGQKVNLTKLVRQRDLLINPQVKAENIDSKGTGLNATEIKLLKDVMESEPFFMAYLENPFMVDTLDRIGVVKPDAYVKEKIKHATYLPLQGKAVSFADQKEAVEIAILPSFTKEFQYSITGSDDTVSDFQPSQVYQEVLRNIRNKVTELIRSLVKAQLVSLKEKETAETVADYDTLAKRFVAKHVAWITPENRPFAIYPENADRVIETLCPKAEFAIIVLGENVYLSFNLTEVDSYPNVDRLFLDIMDVRHNQVDYELSQVAMLIFNKLKDAIK